MVDGLTWVAIVASVFMGLAGVCLFVFVVKKDYLRDFEDAKYQVFWSDLEQDVDAIEKEMSGDSAQQTAGRRP